METQQKNNGCRHGQSWLMKLCMAAAVIALAVGLLRGSFVGGSLPLFAILMAACCVLPMLIPHGTKKQSSQAQEAKEDKGRHNCH